MDSFRDRFRGKNFASKSSINQTENTLNSSFDTLNSSASNRRGEFRTPRMYGDLTMEMIDDFLNPNARAKPEESKHKVNFFLPSATGGRGILNQKSRNDDIDVNNNNNNKFFYSGTRSCLSAQEKEQMDFSYLNLRKEYEHELRRGVYDLKVDHTNVEKSSVVGSNMSQIESVTTMSISNSQKLQLKRKTEQLARLAFNQEDDYNEDLNYDTAQQNLHDVLQKANEMSPIKDVNEDLRRQMHLDELRRDYTTMSNDDAKKLPIYARKEEILETIATHQFLIIVGGTGCGKTTQVPQYILDHHMEQNKYCNIIVTQPRRIAAMSVAKRVCSERDWKMPSICGYQIGLDREHVNEDTRITYVTTGVLLQKLITEDSEQHFLKNYTHIILDEVHERDIETDFVLLVTKIKSFKDSNTKVILMSATIDTRLFRDYFTISSQTNLPTRFSSRDIKAPCFYVSNNSYTVQEFYWDDLTNSGSFLSPLLSAIYKEKVEKLKLFSNDRVQAYDYKSYQSTLKLFDFSQQINDEQKALRDLKMRMEKFEFSLENPQMSQETMLMVIALLKYFDEQERQAVLKSQYYYVGDDESDTDTELEIVFKNRKKVGAPKNTYLNCNNNNKDGAEKKMLRVIDGLAEHRGTVLIFVPGMEHINQLHKLINEEMKYKKIQILPLHSDIIIEQQNQVFAEAESAWRKVIISTKIAESSITVPDIKYIIDFCLTKEVYCDPDTNYTHLRVEWASKSSLDQRRGRAGRVSDGVCFRLITRDFFQQLDTHAVPSILREPLHKVILDVKRIRQPGEPKKILSLALQPPKLSDIERTIIALKEVGALTLKCKSSLTSEHVTPNDGDLTYAGTVMANLPIDVKLAKLILLGHCFGKLRECVIIAAALSCKTFFTFYFKSHLESFKSKWTWSNGWMCDFICILNVYNVYEQLKEDGLFKTKGEEEKWAKSNMIELGRIREVEKLKYELEQRLARMNIRCNRHVKLDDAKMNMYNIDDKDEMIHEFLILKLLIAGAFYPNYFNSIKIDLKESMRMIACRDYRNTVMVKNLPIGESILYVKQLQKLFSPWSDFIKVHLDDSKAMIEFKTKLKEVHSIVDLGVYMAVQMRQLRLPLYLKRLNPKIAAEKLSILKQSEEIENRTVYTHEIDKSTGYKLNLNGSILTDSDLQNSSLSLNRSDSRSTLATDSDKTFQENGDDEEEDNGLLPIRKQTKTRYLSVLSLNSNECIQLESGLLRKARLTAGPNSLVYVLSDPRFVLPAEVDQDKSVSVNLVDTKECGHFVAQINDDKHLNTLKTIHDILNSKSYNLSLLDTRDIHQDTLCCAYYVDPYVGKLLYRTRILCTDFKKKTVQIVYVDYGNRETLKFDDLFEITDDELKTYPFQALECKLYNIKPSLMKNPTGFWHKKSNHIFSSIITNQAEYEHFEIKVVEVEENNTLLVNLFGKTKKFGLQDIGEMLIMQGYAETLNQAELYLYKNRPKNDDLNKYVPKLKSDFISRPAQYDNSFSLNLNENKCKTNNLPLSSASSISVLDHTFDQNSLFDDDDKEHENDDESSFSGVIELKGPYSPLEAQFYSIANVGFSKRVRVERDSINYVSLDDDPTNENTRLMVAAEVTLNADRSAMVLRKTSLLPKIAGLSAICCLLYSPTIELRVDEKYSHFTGALCGLGYDEKNRQAIYPDNDIECCFDSKIDQCDITMINSVRLAINMVIGSEEETKNWTNDPRNLRYLQNTACNKLLQLFLRIREKNEAKSCRAPYIWNQIPKEKKINLVENQENQELYYSYHDCVFLNS